MKAATPPLPLRLGDDVQGHRRLAAGFRAEDFDDPPAGNALAAQGDVQRKAAGRNAGDLPGYRLRARGMIAPSPNCFSIWATVVFSDGWRVEHRADAIVSVVVRL